ncbi:MAG: hypothetical protein HBSAPP03_28280 [Phycisphaerae bacterium]|nr:MAG: hypothetical protein HBSAPP03_28280 [Phycisphaerae bacterium]
MSQISIPPSEPGDLELPPAPVKWPKTVGVISIVWAGLGLVCGGCLPVVGIAAMSMIPPEMKAEFPPNMAGTPALWGLGVIGLLNALLLLIAGIITIRRNPIGGPVHLVYACLAVVLFAGSMFLQFQNQEALARWAAENPGTQFAKQMNMPGQKIGTYVGMAFGAVLGLAYPVFLLVWFGAVKRGASAWPPRDEGVRI